VRAADSNQGGLIASLDLGGMLQEIALDPIFRAGAAELITSVTGKLPGGIVTGEIPLSELACDLEVCDSTTDLFRKED
jgi:hypothetical protein